MGERSKMEIITQDELTDVCNKKAPNNHFRAVMNKPSCKNNVLDESVIASSNKVFF